MGTRIRDHGLLVASFLSGFAALGYELLWTRLLGVSLGHESFAVIGVLAGFFGGMAIGAAVLHGRVHASRDPMGWFVALEGGAATFALVSPFVLQAFADRLPAWVSGTDGGSPSLALAIVLAAVVLLPGTFCLGATLPAMAEAWQRDRDGETSGRGIARLYAANVFGATLGVLVTVHLLLPALGLRGGAWWLGALGGTAATVGAAWRRPRRTRLARAHAAHAQAIDASQDPDPDVGVERWLLLAVLAATGFIGMGFELVTIQVLSQRFENTIYTFANLLAVYLVGTAIGSSVYARFAALAVRGRPAIVAAALLLALALATSTTGLLLHDVPRVQGELDPTGVPEHLLAELAVAALVFLLPTLVMGAAFAHVSGLVAPVGLGRAYAANTLGCALGPLVFGLYVIPEYGYRDALYVTVYAYLFVFGVFTWFRRFKASWQLVGIFSVLASTIAAPSDLVLVDPEDGWITIERRETVMGLVAVNEQRDPPRGTRPLRRLQLGQKFRMGGAMAFGERRMGHIPLLWHAAPERVLFLGVGTGATLGAVVDEPVASTDAVELVPEVIELLPHFADINRRVAEHPRVRLQAADARRFTAATRERYDVIVADLFHPARDGAGGLYAREHFVHVAARLREHGLFAQWLPLYQLDRESLAAIVRTFLDVFPEAHLLLGIYNVQTPAVALIGANGPLRIDFERVHGRLAAPIFRELLLADPRDWLGAYLLDREGLVAWAGTGPLNTDLDPIVSLRSPYAAYADDDTLGWTNLASLLSARRPLPRDLIAGRDETARNELLTGAERSAEALSLYLEAEHLRVDAQTTDAANVPEPALAALLSAYRLAPEFAPARGILFTIAERSPGRAEVIYEAMLAASPDEPRVWQAYLRHLERTGNHERFEALRQDAEARFGR